MDPGYVTVIAIVLAGLAHHVYRARRPSLSGRGGGWVGLIVLAVLLAGLLIAAQLGSESLTWLFGLSLIAAVSIMLFLAVGSAIGRWLVRRKCEDFDERK
jgi:hypothetical protein